MLGSSYLVESGDWAMLKHSEKYWLSVEALSKSLVTVVPFLTKAGLETLFLLSILAGFQKCLWASWIEIPEEMTLDLPQLLHGSVSHQIFSWLLSSNFLSSSEKFCGMHISIVSINLVFQLVKDSLTSPVSTKSQSVSSIRDLTLEKSA